MKAVHLGGVVAAIVGCLSAPAWAQGTSGIAGAVKDTTGAVLPGVTVEATSPVLIEKVRTVVSDEQGVYRFVSLLPGTYTVTFTMPGFNTVKREGIELVSNFTATVDVDLRVGSLEETVTVTGQSPVVDTQNVVHTKVISREMLLSLPINREIGGFAATTVGAVISSTQQDVGGNKDPISQYITIHGSKTNDMRVLLDGMRFNAEGTGRGFYFNPAAAQEVGIELGGQAAEYELGGVQVNMVPKEGGNRLTGYLFSNFSNKDLASDNLTGGLRARGLTFVNENNRLWDLNAAFGGPLRQDKLWFYTSHRYWGYSQFVAGNYYNKTQGAMVYTPDTTRPAIIDETNRSHGLRLTWQASQRNKFSFSYDVQYTCLCHVGLTALVAPEASQIRYYKNPNYLAQGKWNFPISNRLLLEAGGTTLIFDWPNYRQPAAIGAISILEQSRNYRYNAPLTSSQGHRIADQSNQRISLTYVTGSHALKTGVFMQEGWHNHQQGFRDDLGIDYTFLNGSPISLTEWAVPLVFLERLKVNLGLYTQDQWTIDRLTLNLGLRFDYFNAFVPEQHLPAGRFVPERNFARVDCVSCWKDIEPRVGAAYNLFGNGKTAIKGNLGRFVAADIFTINRANNPVQTSVNNAGRTWTDRNNNFIPDCDLTNFAENGECGAIGNSNFGKNDPRATTYAKDVLEGWRARGYNWQVSFNLQHELRPGIGVDFGYYRTWYGSITATENLALAPADFDVYSLTAPVDPRLPGGGGFVIGGLFDVKQSKFGQQRNLVTQARNYGKQTEVYNGLDLTFHARLPKGQITGGMNTGSTATNNCEVVLGRPQITFNSPNGITAPRSDAFCKPAAPWLTQFKVSGTYPLPAQFTAGWTYQNLPGIPVYATYVAQNAEIVPSLGRNLAAGPRGTVSIDLIAPNTRFEDRIKQLDVRLARTFRIANTRLQVLADLYNVLNASPILAINSRYGPSWLTPTEILAGRVFKFGAQLDF